MISAPAASAWSTSARLCASTSILRFGLPLTCARDGRFDSSCQTNVVVLDQDRVVEAGAVVRAAARSDGVFFKHPERRRRLARIEHGDPAARGVDELTRPRRDARKPLEKIERGSLRDEQGTGGAGHDRDLVARRAAFAVEPPAGDGNRRVDLTECFGRDIQAGEHAGCFHDEHAAGTLGRLDRRERCHIPAADVLFEGAAHEVTIVCRIEPLHAAS